jgi:hypothetical protein
MNYTYTYKELTELFNYDTVLGIGGSVTNDLTGARYRHAVSITKVEWDKKTDLEKHELRKYVKKLTMDGMRKLEEQK